MSSDEVSVETETSPRKLRRDPEKFLPAPLRQRANVPPPVPHFIVSNNFSVRGSTFHRGEYGTVLADSDYGYSALPVSMRLRSFRSMASKTLPILERTPPFQFQPTTPSASSTLEESSLKTDILRPMIPSPPTPRSSSFSYSMYAMESKVGPVEVG